LFTHRIWFQLRRADGALVVQLVVESSFGSDRWFLLRSHARSAQVQAGFGRAALSDRRIGTSEQRQKYSHCAQQWVRTGSGCKIRRSEFGESRPFPKHGVSFIREAPYFGASRRS
jgi:hypothetical protein